MEPDELDTVGFLLGDAARVLRNRFDQYARTLGVTRQQWLVLVALLRQEPVSQAKLAAYLEVEPISLCRMVDRLQAAALVERRIDPRDRRVRMLHLTPAAHELLTALRACGAKVLAEASRGVEPAELAEFVETLEQFRANLAPPGGPARAS
jgi:DNA-binding MarR family transcriptional regulator